MNALLQKFYVAVLDPAYSQEQQWRSAVLAIARRPGLLFDMGGGTPYQGYIGKNDVGAYTKYFSLDTFYPAQPHVVADIMQIPLATESVDTVLCNAVLEHVQAPQRAIDEMYRVLKKGGCALLAVPFIYPYHDRVDFFRFSDTALRHMFQQFDNVEISPVGDYFFASLLFFTGFHFRVAIVLSPILHFLRFGLRLLMWLYNRGGDGSHKKDYLGSMQKSPVGWYIYCTK